MQMDFTEEERRIIEALRFKPELKESFKEMLAISEDTIADIKSGDDAEEATIQAIHKAGQQILTTWLQRRSKQLEEKASRSLEMRPHEKKSSVGEQRSGRFA